MSMDRCEDCGDLIDTDESPELYVGPRGHEVLLCEACQSDVRWCSKCLKPCDEEEEVETFSLGEGSSTTHHGYLVSHCCGEATWTVTDLVEREYI